jgi:hypothetical protein
VDCVTLVRHAQSAGLHISVNGDQLVVRGPRSAADLAQQVLARKQDVMALLISAPSPRIPTNLEIGDVADAYLDGLALAAEQERIGGRMWASANADASDRDEWVAMFRAHADTWRRWRDAQTGEGAAIAQRLDQALQERLFAQMDDEVCSTGFCSPRR